MVQNNGGSGWIRPRVTVQLSQPMEPSTLRVLVCMLLPQKEPIFGLPQQIDSLVLLRPLARMGPSTWRVMTARAQAFTLLDRRENRYGTPVRRQALMDIQLLPQRSMHAASSISARQVKSFQLVRKELLTGFSMASVV